ncbi:MAG TPA: 1,4-dihydroxy-6-naphthoate synthase [Candidatus Syntrophoarchaeum butanivorans]|uniref:1,4-dihydroxy-6-naphtoate synthase n=1 Tax=Candidatus Syntropharchaeum butanivorans TaxID=1839936 RepID=A0A1F2P4P6_9EURY|nr:MAG: 1,4-dihydroxy-6-naphthoate synthase [Candidatus Syntrophoarchaeum butanivorans]HEC57791.1 1,4-dihydroxy-6-naphthoate synthase [Candidatus Syntrophoarchaeum butanivorans]
MNLTVGYSPCPNDTFIFYALMHGRIETGEVSLRAVVEDVESLNRMALNRALDVTKVSFHAFGFLRDHYALLHAGAALGRGCGPIIVSREKLDPDMIKNKRIAVPGTYTTANLLLRLFEPEIKEIVMMPFDRIIPAVAAGEVDCGVVIHEGRFTYRLYGLREVIDLGRWWEEETGLLIPLGGIIIDRRLGKDLIHRFDRWLRASIQYALERKDEPRDYIKHFAQEMDDSVISEHIGLYVNDYTLDIGKDGIKAVEQLLKMGEEAGVIPHSDKPLFLD